MIEGKAARESAPLPRFRPAIRWPKGVQRHPLVTTIVLALALRLALAPLTAHLPNGLTDEGFWKHWMQAIDQDGVLNIFRTTDTDYVGYHWVLWALSLVYRAMGGSSYSNSDQLLHLLVKLPSIAFDVVLIIVVYRATTVLLRQAGLGAAGTERGALVAAVVIAFQPAVLYDGSIWAQTDSMITAAMLGALVLASLNRPFAAGSVWALGLAVKPHPIILGPVLLVLLWRAGGSRALVRASGGLLLVLALVLGPWVLTGELLQIVHVYDQLFTKERERLSELAWNGWWIFDQRGNPRPADQIGDLPITFKQASLSLSLMAAGISTAFVVFRPGLRNALVAAAYIAMAFYMLPIGSHERYLFPFLGLLLPVAILEARWRWLYGAVSVTFFLNLFVVAPPLKRWMDRWVYEDFGVMVAGFNVVFFLIFTLLLISRMVMDFVAVRSPDRRSNPPRLDDFARDN